MQDDSAKWKVNRLDIDRRRSKGVQLIQYKWISPIVEEGKGGCESIKYEIGREGGCDMVVVRSDKDARSGG